eukprot:scaffold90_cov163-Ochromonas_danica.AAC.3
MDIRSFFGGTKRASSGASKAEPPTTSTAEEVEAHSKRKAETKGMAPQEEIDLLDSDVEKDELKQTSVVVHEEDIVSAPVSAKAPPTPLRSAAIQTADNRVVKCEDSSCPKTAPNAHAAKEKSSTELLSPPPMGQNEHQPERLPLQGARVAVSGAMPEMGRSGIEELIAELGGKVSATVTGKTSFLVVGNELEDGRAVSEGSKFRTAREKNVPILTEADFLSKYRLSSSQSTNNIQGGSYNDRSSPPLKSFPQAPVPIGVLRDSLWVDFHRPKTPSELIGHGELSRKLSEWLDKWAALHVKHSLKMPFGKENAGAKAVLLSGPPGIGKSTLASVVANQLGFDILELNASDTRNKSEIDSRLQDAVSSRSITSSHATDLNGRRRLVIMDEVDGMGGSDRGGMAELIKIIKISKVPIVCICNDRQSPKVRSLANHCYDLRVKRPTKSQIAVRLVHIAAQEGLQVDSNAAEMLVEQSGNDIRQAINALQMWRYSKHSLAYNDIKGSMSRIEKDKVLRQTPFDACLQILGGEKSSFEERYGAFFIDYSLSPLIIQQNYIDAAKNGVFRNPQKDDVAKIEALAKAASAISDVDLIGSKIRGQDQHWELLPCQAASCLAVGNPIAGFQAFPTFPAWLGKFSSTNKTSRLVREIVQHSSLSVGQGFQVIRLDFIPFLRQKFLHYLTNDGKAGVEDVISLLGHYGLTKEDLMESFKDMQVLMPNEKDPYDRIDSQVKSSLTRAYNSSAHISQTAVPVLGAEKRKVRVVSDESLDMELGEEALEAKALSDEEEGDESTPVDPELAKTKLGIKSSQARSKGGGKGRSSSQSSTAAAGRKKK